MPLGAVIGAVGGIIAGSQAKKGAQAAAGASVEASRLGIEAQERATEQLRQDLAPYSGFGLGALGPLSQALGIPLVQGQVQPQVQPTSTGIVDFQQSQGLPVPKPSFNKLAYTPQARATTGAADTTRQQQILDELASLDIRRTTDYGNPKIGGVINRNAAENRERLLNELASLPQTPESAQYLQDSASAGDLPQNIFQQLTSGSIEFGPTGQQQATVPQAPAAPFNSRAEAIMGGSNNPLLQQAIAMRQDGSEVLQNPLLRAMQDDVTRRLMANQAARGKLGSGGTAEELQNRLIPQALAFREQEISGLTNLGITGEDIRQREVNDLFRAAGLGQVSAARTGAAGLTAAGNIGNLQQAAGAAQGQGALGSAYANNLMLGGVLQGAQQFFQPTVPSNLGSGSFSFSPGGAGL